MKIVNQSMNLSYQVLHKLKALGCNRHFEDRFAFIPKFSFCGVEEKKTKMTGLRRILQDFEKKSASFKHGEKVRYFEKIVRGCNKQTPTLQQSKHIDKYLQQIFQAILLNPHGQKPQYLQQILQVLCLNTLKKIVKRSKQREKLNQLITNSEFAEGLLQIFPSASYPIRTLILKYFSFYYFSNGLYFEKLLSLIQGQSFISREHLHIDELIKYLYTSILFINQSKADGEAKLERRTIKTPNLLKSQFWTSSLKLIYENIMLASPKMLFYLTQEIVGYCEIPNIFKADYILAAVTEHRKGLAIIQSQNISDIMYLLQVLQNVLKAKSKNLNVSEERVREETILLYNQIKNILKVQQKKEPEEGSDELQIPKQEQQEDEGQSKVNKEIIVGQATNLIAVNIIQESMLKLSVIDAPLFGELEEIFFRILDSAEIVDISIYIMSRVKIVKAVLANLRSEAGEKKPEKVRLVKQQHKRFITKLMENISNSERINKKEILKLLQICQQVPIKSRKIKSILNQFASASDPQLRGLMEAIRDTF